MPYYKQANRGATALSDQSEVGLLNVLCSALSNSTSLVRSSVRKSDIYGNILEKVTAKEDGLILYQRKRPWSSTKAVLLAVASKNLASASEGRHD